MPFINGYGAIQKELEQRGHWLRTRSDSEIALHLYEECGAACLQRLRDEFAIALWDQPNQSLLPPATGSTLSLFFTPSMKGHSILPLK